MAAPLVTMKYGRAAVGGTREATPDMNPASGTRSERGERKINTERGVEVAGPSIPAGFRLTFRTSAHKPREQTHVAGGRGLLLSWKRWLFRFADQEKDGEFCVTSDMIKLMSFLKNLYNLFPLSLKNPVTVRIKHFFYYFSPLFCPASTVVLSFHARWSPFPRLIVLLSGNQTRTQIFFFVLSQ